MARLIPVCGAGWVDRESNNRPYVPSSNLAALCSVAKIARASAKRRASLANRSFGSSTARVLLAFPARALWAERHGGGFKAATT
ncbi:uncharacterized protein UV8b_04931 [Ustilaginoidea virens]|uniref:Uncharacterized protein n=1 Tax=Ustilaginoidea virens TaxID=1159556 RepID=A0A8E5HS84_USTVR|nr:uncharacterized protein UV8b_04931 [Ustilaginoidea virens]QUC20690.1 hypothetical protein UV8b_04931 [Ustilaginoidea virens]